MRLIHSYRLQGQGRTKANSHGNCRYVQTAIEMDRESGDLRYHRNDGIRGIYLSQTGEWLENHEDYATFKVFCGTAKGWLLICEDCRRRPL